MTMIKVLSGEERYVYDFLQKMREVRDIYRLFGEYDFFLVLQADGRKGLSQILSRISEEQNVVKTANVLFTADGDIENGEMDYAAALGAFGK